MKLIMFFQVNDTVINSSNPIDTYTVICAEQIKGLGNWITLRHVHNLEIISGWEAELQENGFYGYRVEHFVQTW